MWLVTLAGTYQCSLKTPLGTIDGNMLLCRLELTQPMRMSAECEIIVDGDTLVGFVTAGRFGEMALSGKRVA
jgi:hypothetical protein